MYQTEKGKVIYIYFWLFKAILGAKDRPMNFVLSPLKSEHELRKSSSGKKCSGYWALWNRIQHAGCVFVGIQPSSKNVLLSYELLKNWKTK